jgi:hypothetical protein
MWKDLEPFQEPLATQLPSAPTKHDAADEHTLQTPLQHHVKTVHGARAINAASCLPWEKLAAPQRCQTAATPHTQ